MSLQYGFFNSVEINTEIDGETVTVNDREYDAEFFTELLKAGFRSGVSSGSFVVSLGSGLTVNISSGRGFYGGFFFYDSSASTLTCNTATGTRTDLAVFRLNSAARTMELVVKEGTTSVASGELALAKITVTGSEVIAVENLSDGRNYGAKCGSAASIDGHAVFIQQSQPSSPKTGDLWFW